MAKRNISSPRRKSNTEKAEVLSTPEDHLRLNIWRMEQAKAEIEGVSARGVCKLPSLKALIKLIGRKTPEGKALYKAHLSIRKLKGEDYTLAYIDAIDRILDGLKTQQYQAAILKNGPVSMRRWVRDPERAQALYKLEPEPDKLIALHLKVRQWGYVGLA